MRGMDSKQIRRHNLRQLISEAGGQAALARRAETAPAYISQIISPKTNKEIGDSLARRLEQAFGKHRGWMDTPHFSEVVAKDLAPRIQRRLDALGLRLPQQEPPLDRFNPRWLLDYVMLDEEALQEFVQIAQALGRTPEWLLFGSGPDADPAGDENPDSAAQAAKLLGKLSRLDPAPTTGPDAMGEPLGPRDFGNIRSEPRPIKAFDDNDPLTSDEIQVQRLTLKLSAGSGRLQWEIDAKGSPNRYRRAWCERMGFDPAKLVSVQAEGESMSPAITDSASVTLNTNDTRIRNGKIYAIDYQGEFYIKRLMMEPDGAVRVTSDNPDKTRYPDWTVTPEHGDVLRVLGRAVQVQNDL
ncbi:hypothetical protein GCM10027296_23820 [Chitinimonas naiadis]